MTWDGRPLKFSGDSRRFQTRRVRVALAVTIVSGLLAAVSSQTHAQAPAPPGVADCNDDTDPGTPLGTDGIAGKWTDTRSGKTVELLPKDAGGKANPTVTELHFTLKGQHEWEGTYENGKLTFTRTPTADEMDRGAEPWARKAVEGKLKWKMELSPLIICGKLVLRGPWYPGLIEIDRTLDRDGKVANQSAKLASEGKPIAMRYERELPGIAGVVVLQDQAVLGSDDPCPQPGGKAVSPGAQFDGTPRYSYPFQKGAAVNALGEQGQQRTLFVYGRGLPRDWSKITIENDGDDGKGLEYTPRALDIDKTLTPEDKACFAEGRRLAARNITDPSTRQLFDKLESMLIRVDLRRGVLPGVKEFSINNVRGNSRWRLRFGDDRALVGVGREIVEGSYELTASVFLPERVFFEVRTQVDFPLDDIPLVVRLDEKDVSWSGADTIVAHKVPKPIKSKWQQHLEEALGIVDNGAIYRTGPVEVHDASNTPPTRKGVFYLPAAPDSHLYVRLADPFLLGVTPPVADVTIWRTPAGLGLLWRTALQRAAQADGVDAGTWDNLSAKQATEFANYIVTNIAMEGRVRQSIVVTVADHAALLLAREEFVRRLQTEAEQGLPVIRDEADLRGFRKALAPVAWQPSSPWSFIRVNCPGVGGGGLGVSATSGNDCPYYYANSSDYLKRTFGDDEVAADKWALSATAEAIDTYRLAILGAIKKARAVEDKNIDGLMDLFGRKYVYDSIKQFILPRMMRLADLDANGDVIKPGDDAQPVAHLWIPALDARATLQSLDTLTQALIAQRAYSSADTAVDLAILSIAQIALVTPYVLGSELVAAVANWALDTVNLVIALANEVPEYVRQRSEVDYALGASIAIGTERLIEATAKQKAWFELLLSLAPGAGGEIASTYRVVGEIRSALLLTRLESGGASAFAALSHEDRIAFLRMVAEAKLTEARSMTKFQRRVVDTLDKLVDELKLRQQATESIPRATASGEAGPAVGAKPPDEPPKLTPEQIERENRAKQDTIEPPGEPPHNGSTQGMSADEKLKNVKEAQARAAARAGADAAAVQKATPWRTVYEGVEKEFLLGAKISEGKDFEVWELVEPDIPGCKDGCVIKIYKGGRREAAEVFADIKTGSDLLGNDILQLKNVYYSSTEPALRTPGAAQPYLIQELKPRRDLIIPALINEVRDADGNLISGQVNPIFRAKPEFQEALCELFLELIKKDLIWEDPHLKNIFFRQVGENKWKAGILDQDRIIKFSDRSSDRVGMLIAWVEGEHGLNLIKSLAASRANRFAERWSIKKNAPALSALTPRQKLDFELASRQFFLAHRGPYYPSARYFMMKMLEYKGYIVFDEAASEFKPYVFDPDVVKRYFPELEDPGSLAPLDLTTPYFKEQSMVEPPGSGARVIELAALRAPMRARIAADDGSDWRRAA